MFQIKAAEKIKIHISNLITFFSKNRALYEVMSKKVVVRGHKGQYGGALNAGLVKLHARKYTPAVVNPHSHAHSLTHARAHTHTHTHTHTQKKVILLLFQSNNGFVKASLCAAIRTSRPL
jgi:hypothetical protein